VTAMGIDNITILPHPPQGGSIRETMQRFAQVIRPKIDPSSTVE